VVVGLIALGLVRATATPDLGAAPRGPSAGKSEVEIAFSLAAQLGPALAVAPHAQARLSEQDLTVVVRGSNPDPDRFHNPEARLRDGLVVVSAVTDLGPFTVTAVGRAALQLVQTDGSNRDVSVDIRQIDAGNLSLPGAVRSSIAQRIEGSITLRRLFASDPIISRLRPYLDCVAVTGDSLVLGFHRPDAAAKPDGCNS
jgi:hypothetical protein